MKALIIISDSSYADGYLNFLAQCENGDFYDVAISKDEIAEHIRHYFDAEFNFSPCHLKDGIFKDEAQLVLESWERSENKDEFAVYVTAQKKKMLQFKEANGTTWNSPSCYGFPKKKSAMANFMKNNSFVSYEVVTI